MAIARVIDLTGGYAEVIGNEGDEHQFRLHNPDEDTVIIAPGGEYSAAFFNASKVATDVEVNTDDLDEGVLTFPLVIANGTFKVYRMNPQRTILTIKVEAK